MSKGINNFPPQDPWLGNFRNNNASQIWVPNQKGREPERDYNEINMFDSETAKQAKIESWIAKQVGTKLAEKFPQREWGVKVDVQGQMVIIICETVSLTRGYHIKMGGRTIQELCEFSIEAGAEILERHGITRDRKYNADTTEAMIRDAKGDMIGGDNG